MWNLLKKHKQTNTQTNNNNNNKKRNKERKKKGGGKRFANLKKGRKTGRNKGIMK